MNKMKLLTSKQKTTLEFLQDYQFKYKVRPTLVEVGQHLGVSAAAAQYKVDSLLRKKIIKLNNIYIFSSNELYGQVEL